MVSADRAEQRINAARAKAVAEIKKSPISADRAEQRINSAVNKEIANITGKTSPPPPPPPPRSPSPPPTVTPAPTVAPVVEPVLPAVEATPIAMPAAIVQSVTPAVKSAPIDTVVFVDESFSSELITDLLFEDIAGQELLSIARNDTVNGQAVVYQPIKNLGILRDTYNPNNLLKLQETSDRFFANFVINLSEKIPKIGNGSNGANYYLDLTSGDGIIELINIKSDEQVEVQIANAGTIEDVGI